MTITDQHRKQLQTLMSDPRWAAVDTFFSYFIENNFIHQSLKREDQFNTLWYAAEYEGGKRALLDFKNMLEQEAHKV